MRRRCRLLLAPSFLSVPLWWFNRFLPLPKAKSPAGRTCGAGDLFFGLTLAELEAFASPGLPVLLTFAHTRITRKQTIGAEHRPQIRIGAHQRPGNTMANRASL